MKGQCVRSELTGRKFGRLTVLEFAYVDKGGHSQWKCRCDCGRETTVKGSHLISGNTTSCGRHARSMKHGMRNSRLYHVWLSMKDRCFNKQCQSFKNYGGRGITVCESWKESFEAFNLWAMSNGYDPDAKRGDCTLDRINVDGNYCPENCRWVDMYVQNNNRRKIKEDEEDGLSIHG